MIDNKYALINVLGKGASARVFLSINEMGEQVAVKVISPGQQITPKGAKFVVQKEYEILTALSEHPNIVKCLDSNVNGLISQGDNTEAVAYNVLEACNNGALSHYIRFCGRLEKEIVQFFAMQLLSATQYMHDLGYAHLDIKPENILLDDFFNCKLSDMGSSLDISSTDSMSDKKRGTPIYMAPEVSSLEQGKSYNTKLADAYSLGVTLFVALIGEFPTVMNIESEIETMDSDTIHIPHFIRHSSETFIAKWASLPEDIQALLEGLLHPDPTKRLSISDAMKSEWFNTPTDPYMVYCEMEARKEYMKSN